MKVSKARKKNQEAEKEFTNLSTIEHENILKYFDCFYDGENHICFITELCEVINIIDIPKLYFLILFLNKNNNQKNGDLRAKINENRTEEKFFEVKQIFDWILQATSALKYLHSDEIRIAHRDIKPE
jgi:serine/threonine protein kinase